MRCDVSLMQEAKELLKDLYAEGVEVGSCTGTYELFTKAMNKAYFQCAPMTRLRLPEACSAFLIDLEATI